MRALILESFDAPLKVAEVEQPEPAEGEVRVRVRTSSINGFDVFVASGMARAYTEYRFPVVIGKDFAGTVDAVGEGVTQYAVGEPVFGVVSKPDLHDGAYGEFVTVTVSLGLAKLPDGVPFESAGAVGLAGTAALDSLDSAEVSGSDTVLVSGATGGVGAFAVQLAKGRGARVIATARGDHEAAFVRDLGADAAVDYEGDLAAAVREEASDGVDVVIHSSWACSSPAAGSSRRSGTTRSRQVAVTSWSRRWLRRPLPRRSTRSLPHWRPARCECRSRTRTAWTTCLPESPTSAYTSWASSPCR
jgi:NADPH:quinone reductase-like Zn-dependent oxidoreductase